MSTRIKATRIRDSYLGLVREFPLRPIKDDADYDRATVVLDRLALRGEKDLDPGERDYLDALCVFIEKFDDEHFTLDTSSVTAVEMLCHLMNDSEMSQAGLSKILGIGPSATSMILSGKRPITADHARALGRHFSVEPGLFI